VVTMRWGSWYAQAMPSGTLTLHYAPRTRSFTILWLLEELGVAYELDSFDIHSGRHKQADFLGLNPMGKVPVLVCDGAPISESGAIATYLADRFAAAELAPALDDPQRPAYLRWMFFAAGVIEPALAQKLLKLEAPASTVAWGSFEQMQEVLRAAVRDSQWLLGDRFSAADVVVGAGARFGVMFGAFEQQGPIADYVARLTAREAFTRAEAIEQREGDRFPLPK
ncbi:MAG: glutathione S-transferase family protein, partial [Enhygromyxa sp.]